MRFIFQPDIELLQEKLCFLGRLASTAQSRIGPSGVFGGRDKVIV
jgi:hypothetical protein